MVGLHQTKRPLGGLVHIEPDSLAFARKSGDFMQKRPSGHVDQVNSLAELDLSDQTLDSVLVHIGRLGLQALEGWDAVAASVAVRGKIATYGSTDPRVMPVDQAQYDNHSGPCVDAFESGEVHYFDGVDFDDRWEPFARSAADAGVHSVFSVPLKLNGENLGALNFYSHEHDALREGQREEASLYAAQAAVTLANARALVEKTWETKQLEEGLKTRTIIGQATGLLMAQEGLTSDEAFQKLTKISQTSNMKLREIAQRFVQAWEERAGSEPPSP
jgi:transcriptional regulator with GAF, ATPase, and Fis domain